MTTTTTTEPHELHRILGEMEVIIIQLFTITLNNEQRRVHEALFRAWQESHPNELVLTLLEIMSQDIHSMDLRRFGCILLRRLVISNTPSIWLHLALSTQVQLKQRLIESITTNHQSLNSSITGSCESLASFGKELCQLLGEIAAGLLLEEEEEDDCTSESGSDEQDFEEEEQDLMTTNEEQESKAAQAEELAFKDQLFSLLWNWIFSSSETTLAQVERVSGLYVLEYLISADHPRIHLTSLAQLQELGLRQYPEHSEITLLVFRTLAMKCWESSPGQCLTEVQNKTLSLLFPLIQQLVTPGGCCSSSSSSRSVSIDDDSRSEFTTIISSSQHKKHALETLELVMEFIEDRSDLWNRSVHLPQLQTLGWMLLSLVSGPETTPHQTTYDPLIIEALITLIECLGICRHGFSHEFLSRVLELPFHMMLRITDTREAFDDIEELETLSFEDLTNDNGPVYHQGLELLDRLVSSLGSEFSLPRCLTFIESFMHHHHHSESGGGSTEDRLWTYLHTGLMGLSQLVEWIAFEDLDGPVQCFLTYASSSTSSWRSSDDDDASCHSSSSSMYPLMKIQFAAINGLGQLCLDHAPDFQHTYHHVVLPILLEILAAAGADDDSSSSSTNRSRQDVQLHAAAALVNFFDGCEAQFLVNSRYLEPLMSLLAHHLASPNVREIQSPTLMTLAAVAQVLGPDFERYYLQHFRVLLYQVMTVTCGAMANSTTSHLDIASKGIECWSIILLGVGQCPGCQPTVVQDLETLLKWIEHCRVDPAAMAYVFPAWQRLVQGFGKKFDFCFRGVLNEEMMPNIIESLESIPRGCLSSHERLTTPTMTTTTTVEQIEACRLLGGLISECPANTVFPYMEHILKLLSPLISEAEHVEIRSAAITTMPTIIQVVSQVNRRQVLDGPQIVEFILGKLLVALTKERELEVILTLVQSIQWSFEFALFSQSQLHQILCCVLEVLGESVQRRATRRAQRVIDFDDVEYQHQEGSNTRGEHHHHHHHHSNVILGEEEGENAHERQERELVFLIGECLGLLAKCHVHSRNHHLNERPSKAREFIQSFVHTSWLATVMEMSQPFCLAMDRQFASFVMCDLIEYCEAGCHEYYPAFVTYFHSCLDDPHASSSTHSSSISDSRACQSSNLSQAACYGLGQAAKYGHQAFVPFVQSSVQVLLRWMKPQQQEQQREPEAEMVEEVAQARMIISENAISALGCICQYQASSLNELGCFELVMDRWLGALPLGVDTEEAQAVTERLVELLTTTTPVVFLPFVPRMISILIQTLYPEPPLWLSVEQQERILQCLVQVHDQASLVDQHQLAQWQPWHGFLVTRSSIQI